jgi:hypothetical protein
MPPIPTSLPFNAIDTSWQHAALGSWKLEQETKSVCQYFTGEGDPRNQE